MATKAKPKPKTKPKPKVSLSPTSEKQWQAQDDARTLKHAHEIRNDTARLQVAQAHAMKEMEALKQIQKMK